MDVLLRHNNQRHKLRVDADATLESFMRHVDALTNIAPSRQLLKVGYPPQPLGGLQRSGEGGGRKKGASLRELGIQSNELIIVEEVPAAPEAPAEEHAVGAGSVGHGREGDVHRVNGETAGMLLTKSCPPTRPAQSSSRLPPPQSATTTAEDVGSCCRPPDAATAAEEEEEEEDAYTWEEDDDVGFEDEEEDDEEEAVGMPVGCGGAGGTAGATAPRRAGSAAAPTTAASAAGAGAADVGGGGAGQRRRGGAAAAEDGRREETEETGGDLFLGSGGPRAVDDYLPCEVGAAGAAAESSSSSSWSGGGGARLLRVVGGGGSSHGNGSSSSKKKSFQEAADPSIVGEALRYVVPSDNSCLFTCLCLLAAPHATPQQLRALVGSVIDADPENFTDAVLERPRQEYIEWILSPTSWGGYVELAILAQQLQHEVVCVDVETKRKDFYGDPSTGRRVYLLYDGVHYDAIVARRKRPGGASGADRAAGGSRQRVARPGAGMGAADDLAAEEEYLRVFSPSDREMEAKAAAVAAELHHMKQFTNLQKMAMQCLVCGAGIKDQEHAREHAREFGHANFGETRR